MTAPPDDAASDLQAINVQLRAELDAALAQKEALASRLAQRDVAYEERIAHQSAATAVLKAMSASPGDPQPVFDLIATQAQKLCDSDIVTMWEYDGAMFYLRAVTTIGWPSAAIEAYRQRFPMPANPDPENGAVTAILEKRITHVRDPARDKGIAPAVQALFNVHSGLGVPMIRDNRALGAIMLASRRKGGYSDAQIELLKTFAEQAAIAITSAETYRALQTRTADLQEALEQQTATAELLQVINASPGDLTPVFDALLDNALRLCDAPFGGLYVRDGMQARGVAVRGMPPAYAAFRRENSISLERKEHPLARCMDTCQPIEIVDVATDESIYPEDRPVLMELAGVRSILDVPLVKDGRGVGAIAIYQRTPGQFAKAQIALLENFAAQAVIAMENARLLGELQNRTAELAERNSEYSERIGHQAATIDVLKAMSASPGDPQPVFDLIAERARDLCGAYGVTVFEFDGELIHWRAATGVSDDPKVRQAVEALFPMPITSNIASGRAILTKQIVRVDDLEAEPGINPIFRDITAKSLVIVPMMRGGSAIGALSTGSRERGGLSETQTDLLKTFAEQAVIAITSAETYRALQGRTEELAQRQDELRVIFENMSDGVAMFDETPRLVAWNRKFQQLLDVPDGVLAERLTYENYIRYLAGRGEYGADVNPETQLRRLQDRMGEQYAFERIRPNGRVLEIRHNPVEDGGFVLIYADITERKRNEEELRAARDAAEEASRAIEAAYRDLKAAQANLIQAEKMASLGQLTAGIAHEIKNPLNFVNNFAELSVELIDELKELAAPAVAALDDDRRIDVEDIEATLAGNLEKIVEHGKRADSIVKSMLEHSRGASSERRLVDIDHLVDEALKLAYHGARAQDQSFNATIVRGFAGDIAPIELNPQDMTRVCLNIISNGFYAARRRQGVEGPGFIPMLKVSTRDVSDAVEISVWDNGTGIPSDIRDKLFQPFFTTKPTGEGTGLGLSIAYDIVTKQHGGTIVVESEVGAFTEFTVTIPRQMALVSGTE